MAPGPETLIEVNAPLMGLDRDNAVVPLEPVGPKLLKDPKDLKTWQETLDLEEAPIGILPCPARSTFRLAQRHLALVRDADNQFSGEVLRGYFATRVSMEGPLATRLSIDHGAKKVTLLPDTPQALSEVMGFETCALAAFVAATEEVQNEILAVAKERGGINLALATAGGQQPIISSNNCIVFRPTDKENCFTVSPWESEADNFPTVIAVGNYTKK